MPQILVVKFGTNLVTDTSGRADMDLLESIARQVAVLWGEGRRVAIVSSGAVGMGVAALGLNRRPSDLPDIQAAAAAGQPVLMRSWAQAFEPVGLHVGQVLLTREDADDRRRFLNFRNTVGALWRLGAVPILNENDTVSTDELRGPPGAFSGGAPSFGDNDRLAAVAASALSAQMLVLLSTVPGLLDREGRVVPRVVDLNDVSGLLRNETSAGGTGGMPSKLGAARHVTSAGEPMVLAGGREPDVLLRIVRGESVGTRFEPTKSGRLLGRSRWIASAAPAGQLTLDAGAARAVAGRNASLLPAGIAEITGDFARGDVVELLDPAGRPVARGLTNYDTATVRLIRGKKTSELPALLGEGVDEEVVHRDNMVFWE